MSAQRYVFIPYPMSPFDEMVVLRIIEMQLMPALSEVEHGIQRSQILFSKKNFQHFDNRIGIG